MSPLSSIPSPFAEMEDWLAALPDPAYVFSIRTRRLLCANRRFADLLGYSIDELRRMTLAQIRPVEDLPLLEHVLTALPPQGSANLRYLTRSGDLLFVDLRYRNMNYNLADGSTEQVRFVVVLSSSSEPNPSPTRLSTNPSPGPTSQA